MTTNAQSPLHFARKDNPGTNESFCSFGIDTEDKQNEDGLSIREVLSRLKIERCLPVFEQQEIENINDFVLLQREDLVEMNIPIGIRNRILAFNSYYKESNGFVRPDFRFSDIVYGPSTEALPTNQSDKKQIQNTTTT